MKKWIAQKTKEAAEILGALTFLFLMVAVILGILLAITWPLWAGIAAIKFIFA